MAGVAAWAGVCGCTGGGGGDIAAGTAGGSGDGGFGARAGRADGVAATVDPGLAHFWEEVREVCGGERLGWACLDELDWGLVCWIGYCVVLFEVRMKGKGLDGDQRKERERQVSWER